MLGYPELRDRLILLDGWSKTYAMTGWRLGYSVWPKALFPYRRAPRDQLPFLRQRRRPVRRDRRAGRSAGRGPPHGRGLRRAAQGDRRRAEWPSRRPLHRAGRRVLRLPEHHGDRPVDARQLREPSCSTKRAWPLLSGTSFGAHGEGYLRFSYANSRGEYPRGDASGSAACLAAAPASPARSIA